MAGVKLYADIYDAEAEFKVKGTDYNEAYELKVIEQLIVPPKLFFISCPEYNFNNFRQ